MHKHLFFILFIAAFLLGGCNSPPTRSSDSSSSSASGAPPSGSGTPPSGSGDSPSSGGKPSQGSGDMSDPSPRGSFPESPANGDNQISSEPGAWNTGGTISSEEQIAVLDGALESSMEVFDGMILEERNTIRGIEDANSEEDLPGEGGTGEPLFEEGDLAGGAGQEVTVAAAPGSNSEGASRSTPTGRSGAGHQSGSDIPADLADGSDDDIVARQIREAAIQESDPVLKEKLWEEYRKYKGEGSKN